MRLRLLVAAALVTCPAALVCAATAAAEGEAAAAPPRYRVMYRHAVLTPTRDPARHEVVRSHLAGAAARRRRRRRALLGLLSPPPSDASLRLGSLGDHVGVDYVDLDDAVAAAWVAAELGAHPAVAWAELDAPVSSASSSADAAPPDDPEIPSQPALATLGLWTASPLPRGALAAPAWARTAGARSVVVCVMDSGLDYSHPDIAPNLWVNEREVPGNGVDDDGNGYVDDVHGTNVLEITGDVMDDYFHGTHLAGIVGAACHNGLGGCGVSPVVRLMGCKFLDSRGNGYASDAVRCLNYAIMMKADITLNSYGGLYADSDALRTAIAAAEAAGQLFVAAAGNDRGRDLDDAPTYPASYGNGNILTVIATDVDEGGGSGASGNGGNSGGSGGGVSAASSPLALPSDAPDGRAAPPPPPPPPPGVANFSNYGARTAHIAAPGIGILSTVPGSGYARKTGTSQAAAYVAGGAALLLAALRQVGDGNQTAVEVRDALLAGVRKSPGLDGKCSSGGTLDVGAAMALIPTTGPPRKGAADWLLGVAASTGRTAAGVAAGDAAGPPQQEQEQQQAGGAGGGAGGGESSTEAAADAAPARTAPATTSAFPSVAAGSAGKGGGRGGGMTAADAAAARGAGGSGSALSGLVAAGLLPQAAVESAAKGMGLPEGSLGRR